MEAIFSALLKYGIWGLLAVIFVVISLSVVNNPAIISELTKLFYRFRKHKKDIDYGNFKLFNLTRTTPRSWILVAKIYTTIVCSLMIISYVTLLLLLVKIPSNTINPGVHLFMVFFFFLFPTIFLIDIYLPIRSSVNLELDGDFDTLLRFCLKRIFDIRTPIVRFNVEGDKGEIETILYGNHTTIKVEKAGDSRNRFTLSSDVRFISKLFYSAEYQREINDFVRGLCYPGQTLT